MKCVAHDYVTVLIHVNSVHLFLLYFFQVHFILYPLLRILFQVAYNLQVSSQKLCRYFTSPCVCRRVSCSCKFLDCHSRRIRLEYPNYRLF